MNYKIWNEDCIEGSKNNIKDGSVDLIICDPPFGINESKFEERLNHLKLQLCRKFGVTDIFCQWTKSTSTFRLSMHVPGTVGNFKYNYEHTDIEIFIKIIEDGMLKDQIREDKLNILLK